MRLKFVHIIILFIIPFSKIGQFSIEDTIPINEVLIKLERGADKQTAGVKIERIDTLVLIDKNKCFAKRLDTIYFINNQLWKMPVTDNELLHIPFIENDNKLFYSLEVDPVTFEVYLADAVDHMQSGWVYRYAASGNLLDSFKVHSGQFLF